MGNSNEDSWRSRDRWRPAGPTTERAHRVFVDSDHRVRPGTDPATSAARPGRNALIRSKWGMTTRSSKTESGVRVAMLGVRGQDHPEGRFQPDRTSVRG